MAACTGPPRPPCSARGRRCQQQRRRRGGAGPGRGGPDPEGTVGGREEGARPELLPGLGAASTWESPRSFFFWGGGGTDGRTDRQTDPRRRRQGVGGELRGAPGGFTGAIRTRHELSDAWIENILRGKKKKV